MKTEKGTELPLSHIKGKEYLEVKYRVVWFREVKPDWGIETSFLQMSNTEAIALAIIKNEQGRIMATAHKHENQKGFADFLEKAETGAIGRALGLLGFGTAHALEFEEGERLADAPVSKLHSVGDKGYFESLNDKYGSKAPRNEAAMHKQQVGIREPGEEPIESLMPLDSTFAEDYSLHTPPKCCNKPMMISKYNDKQWYCPSCKRKQER